MGAEGVTYWRRRCCTISIGLTVHLLTAPKVGWVLRCSPGIRGESHRVALHVRRPSSSCPGVSRSFPALGARSRQTICTHNQALVHWKTASSKRSRFLPSNRRASVRRVRRLRRPSSSNFFRWLLLLPHHTLHLYPPHFQPPLPTSTTHNVRRRPADPPRRGVQGGVRR